MKKEKYILPIFDPSIVKDYSADGTDSVDGKDFCPGFGCVIEQPLQVLLPPPAVNCTLSPQEIESEFHYQEWLKKRYEDEY